MFGVGLDLVEIVRMRAVLRRWGNAFVRRVFTERERMDPTAPNAAAHFAVRFAAKEAFVKALGTGLTGGLTWHDVEVVSTQTGAPHIVLGGRAAARSAELGAGAIHLSLTHARATAGALVVIERTRA